MLSVFSGRWNKKILWELNEVRDYFQFSASVYVVFDLEWKRRESLPRSSKKGLAKEAFHLNNSWNVQTTKAKISHGSLQPLELFGPETTYGTPQTPELGLPASWSSRLSPQTDSAAVCHQLRWNKLQDACSKSDEWAFLLRAGVRVCFTVGLHVNRIALPAQIQRICMFVKLLSRLDKCRVESGLIHWKYKVLRQCALQQMASL